MDEHFIFFFLDEFHHGTINHIIHFVGFTVLGYGLGKRQWMLVIVSPFIMELGHIFNYLTGRHSEHAITIIPLQWLAWVVFVGFGVAVAKVLENRKRTAQRQH